MTTRRLCLNSGTSDGRNNLSSRLLLWKHDIKFTTAGLVDLRSETPNRSRRLPGTNRRRIIEL